MADLAGDGEVDGDTVSEVGGAAGALSAASVVLVVAGVLAASIRI